VIETHCPICGHEAGCRVIYKENLPLSKIVFSTRKTPDYYHCRIVKCNQCGLLYSNPFLENNQINKLYKESQPDYNSELENLKATYGYYLKRIENLAPAKKNILEIGCGNGFFLEKALEMGFQNVYGIEPSNKEIKRASLTIKDKIIHDMFKPKYFQNNFFDVICFFQVIEHVVDINEFLAGCFKCLKKNGLIFCIAHDFDSFLARMLKDKCPIINDEHVYIFNKETLRKIFLKNNFQVIKIDSVTNIYSLSYWFKMTPLPRFFKKFIFSLLSFLKIANKKVGIKAGNIFIVARK